MRFKLRRRQIRSRLGKIPVHENLILNLGVAPLILAANAPVLAAEPAQTDYDIVYVRAPRYGDEKNTRWPEVKDPIRMEPGADLMLLRNDGGEEGLVEESFTVVADFEIDRAAAGENLAAKFEKTSPGVWAWTLATPISILKTGQLTVSVDENPLTARR